MHLAVIRADNHDELWKEFSLLDCWSIRILSLSLCGTTFRWERFDSSHITRVLTRWFSSKGENDDEPYSFDGLLGILDIYEDFIILEERIQGTLSAFEGIRLVKERKKTAGL